jgi:hypothetical protein
MINLTNFQTDVLSRDLVEAFYILQIEYKYTLNYTSWTTSYKRLSTFNRDITLSDGRTYLGNAPLIELQPPKISSEVDREQYVITLADVNYEFGPLSENNLVGMPVEVGIVFIDPISKLPNLSASEVLIVYKGQIDSSSYSIDTSEIGATIYKLSCASPVADLDSTKPFYSSKSFMREKIKASDSSFDQVAQGTGTLRLKWGRV